MSKKNNIFKKIAESIYSTPKPSKKPSKKPPIAKSLTIIRYSTNDSSWMSVYASPKIALVHAKENLEIHFGEGFNEDELAEHLDTLETAIVNGHSTFEAEDFNVEIEYGEKVYTE